MADPIAFLTSQRCPLFVPNTDADNIGPNKTARFKLPVGPTYNVIWIKCQKAGPALMSLAEILASISNVRLLIDGIEKWNLKIGHLIYAQAEFYEQGVCADGMFPIFLARPWMEVIENQDGPGYGTRDVDSFVIEIGQTGGSVITQLTAVHELSPPEDLGAHQQMIVLPRSRASAGLESINDLPIDPSTRLYALHIAVDPATIDTVELIAGGNRELYGTPKELHRRYARGIHRRYPQANYLHLDFVYRGRHADSLPMIMSDVQLKVLWNTAPNSYDIVMDLALNQQPKKRAG